MPTDQSPHNWQQQLSPDKLPVDAAVKKMAIQQLHAHNANANNIADLITADPVLVLRIVHNANRSLTRTGNEIKSIPHAISLLGFTHTEAIIDSAPEYSDTTPNRHDALRQQVSISLHAAWQLQCWAQEIQRWSGEAMALAALLHRAPLWALWHQAPELMQSLQRDRAAHGGASHTLLVKRHLHCSLEDMAATLCQEWHLPCLAQHGWLSDMRGSHRQWIQLSKLRPEQAASALQTLPELQRLSSHPAFAVALANRFADQADWDWYSSRTLRLQSILAACLCKPLATAVNMSHQWASSLVTLADTQHPSHRLLGAYCRSQALQRHSEPTAPSYSLSQRPADELDSTPTAPESLVELVIQLRRQPAAFSNLSQLFQQAFTLLSQDVPLDRVCALLIRGAGRELRTVFAVGCEESPALTGFHYRFRRGDLFSRLLQQPLGLHIQADNYSKVSSLLPASFKQACATNQFFMMSIFADSKPIGIIYADQAMNKRSLTGRQYAMFKQLCSAISRCISDRAGSVVQSSPLPTADDPSL